MITTIAIVLIVFSILQIISGIAVFLGKFDPLLPKERKKLSAKNRRKAQLLNAISMIATSVIFIIYSIGILLNIEILSYISAGLMIAFIIVMLVVSLKVEVKHLR